MQRASINASLRDRTPLILVKPVSDALHGFYVRTKVRFPVGIENLRERRLPLCEGDALTAHPARPPLARERSPAFWIEKYADAEFDVEHVKAGLEQKLTLATQGLNTSRSITRSPPWRETAAKGHKVYYGDATDPPSSKPAA